MVQTPARGGPLSPKVRERKRQILEAASRIFRRHGLHSAGMRQIAGEVGMAVGNLYYYFDDKQELLAFCQEDALDGLLRLAAEVESGDAPPDRKLRRLIAGHVVRLNEETPGSLAHLEVEALEPHRRQPILARRAEYEAAFRRILDEGITAGVFRPADSKLAALAILGAINWTVRWFRAEGPKTAREVGEEFADLLVGGLLAPGGRRGAGARKHGG